MKAAIPLIVGFLAIQLERMFLRDSEIEKDEIPDIQELMREDTQTLKIDIPRGEINEAMVNRGINLLVTEKEELTSLQYTLHVKDEDETKITGEFVWQRDGNLHENSNFWDLLERTREKDILLEIKVVPPQGE